jgi:hypothetical protein
MHVCCLHLSLSCAYEGRQLRYRTVPFGARVSVHCSLIPCVKAYRASLANSVLDERVGSTTPLIAGRPEENTLRNYFLVADSSMRNGSWYGCNTSHYPIGENTYSPYPARLTANSSAFPFGQVPRCYIKDCVWLSGE